MYISTFELPYSDMSSEAVNKDDGENLLKTLISFVSF